MSSNTSLQKRWFAAEDEDGAPSSGVRIQGMAVAWKDSLVYYIKLEGADETVWQAVAGMMNNVSATKVTFELKQQLKEITAGEQSWCGQQSSLFLACMLQSLVAPDTLRASQVALDVVPFLAGCPA